MYIDCIYEISKAVRLDSDECVPICNATLIVKPKWLCSYLYYYIIYVSM